MLILGIDPGIVNLGLCIYDSCKNIILLWVIVDIRNGTELKPHKYDGRVDKSRWIVKLPIKTTKTWPIGIIKNMNRIFDIIIDANFIPDIVVIERQFRNKKTECLVYAMISYFCHYNIKLIPAKMKYNNNKRQTYSENKKLSVKLCKECLTNIIYGDIWAKYLDGFNVGCNDDLSDALLLIMVVVRDLK